MGVDLQGQDAAKASLRAARDAVGLGDGNIRIVNAAVEVALTD